MDVCAESWVCLHLAADRVSERGRERDLDGEQRGCLAVITPHPADAKPATTSLHTLLSTHTHTHTAKLVYTHLSTNNPPLHTHNHTACGRSTSLKLALNSKLL